MDLLVAMKFQQEMYAEDEFTKKPPIKAPNYAPVSQFSLQVQSIPKGISHIF